MLTIIDVENMPAAELKARADEITAAIKDHPDLAARYVQARADAKLRDERLADQGAAITALEARSAAADLANTELAEKYAVMRAAISDQASQIVQAAERERALEAKLAAATAEGERLLALAKSRRAALATVLSDVNAIGAKVTPLLIAEG